MTRFRLGHRTGVGPLLKIMKNDTDDPWTTPNNDHGKFVFNSETTSLSYILGMEKFEYGGPSVYPPGSGSTNQNLYYPRPHHTVASYTLSGQHYENHYFDFQAAYGLAYWPMVEVRRRRGTVLMEAIRYLYATVYSYAPSHGSAEASSFAADAVGIGTRIFVSGVSTLLRYQVCAFVPSDRNLVTAAVWEFPAENVAYNLPSGTPVSGQKVLEISQTRAAMARPGFTVAATNPRHFIFNSNRVPAKILAAGEVTIAAGSSATVAIDSAFHPLSAFTYVDMHARFTISGFNLLLHPPVPDLGWVSWDAEGATLDYRVFTERVVLYNTGTREVVARYLVVSHDDQGQSSGSNAPVLRGVQGQYVQVCRPGANIPPRLNDILVDSRLPMIPIVAEGWIPNASFSIASDNAAFGTHRAADVTFVNPGNRFRPFLKFFTVIRQAYPDGTIIDMPFPAATRRFWNSPNEGNWHGKHSSHSTMARIENTYVRFYRSPGNPATAKWGPGSPSTPPAAPVFVASSPVTVLGVRYFILAIPI